MIGSYLFREWNRLLIAGIVLVDALQDGALRSSLFTGNKDNYTGQLRSRNGPETVNPPVTERPQIESLIIGIKEQ